MNFMVRSPLTCSTHNQSIESFSQKHLLLFSSLANKRNFNFKMTADNFTYNRITTKTPTWMCTEEKSA